MKNEVNRALVAKKKFYLLTILCALLGMNQAWAAWDGSGEAVKYENNTYYVLYETGETKIDIYQTNTKYLSGPGGQLSFDGSRDYLGGGNLTVTDNNGYEYFAQNPGKQKLTSVEYVSYGPFSIQDARTVTELNFKGGTTLAKYVKNVFVTMAQYVEAPSSSKVEFEAAYLNAAASVQTVTVAWCNVPAMTFEITGDDKAQFDVEIADNAEAGKFNKATFTISYKHDIEGEHSAMLVIKDSYGNYNKSVILSGETKKHDNTIVWSVEEAWKDWNEQIDLNATSDNNENEIQYAVSNEAYATIADGKVTFLEAGAGQEVKVTVSQAESDNYYAAKPLVKTFHIKRQQVLSWDDAVVNANMAIGAERDITGYAVPQFATTESVTYSSADPEIISVENNVLTANAVGAVEITASIAADEQNRATEIHKTFTVKEKESVVVKQGDAIIALNSELVLHLGETSGEITSSNAKNTLQIVVENESVAIYNSETKKLEAVAVGETKVTFAQAAIDEYLEYANEITVKVELVENTLSVIEEAEKFVGEELVDFYVLGNNDSEITVESSDETIARYEEGKIIIPNSEAKSFDETVVTLTVRQAQKGDIAGAEKTITLTVKKYENTIKVNGEAAFSTTLMPGATLPIAITSDNTDKAELIECNQTAGENYVKIIEGVATTNYRTGTATWSVSQPEDYKYQAANATFSIKVQFALEDEEKKLYIYESEAKEEGWKCSEFGEKSWTHVGVAARLWFEAERTSLLSKTLTPQQSINGVWSTAESEIGGSMERNNFKPFDKELNANATAIKFDPNGNDNDIYIRNVKVEVNSHLLVNDFVIDAIPGDKATDTLRVQYGVKNGGDLKIACDNALFYFGADSAASYTIAGSDGKVGEAKIPVHFVVPDEELKDTANIVIYNGVYSNTIKIVVVVGKITPVISADNVELVYGENVDLAATVNVDTLNLNYEVTEGADVILISGGKIYANKAGEAKIKISTDATKQYNAAEKEITVTVNKATPEITTKPQAADIKLGQTLSESYLNGGEANVDGTFAWQDGSIEPDSAVTYQFNVVFTPNDTENYNSVIFEVDVKVTDTGTDVDNTKSEVKATKILRNGQVLILRDGKVYNIQGMEVR